MSTVSFIKVLADLTMATGMHMMPPDDNWQSPQEKDEDTKNNYINGVGQGNWGPGYMFADGIVTYFGTQDMHAYHFQTANVMTKAYREFIYTMIDATQYAFNLWKPTLFFKNLKINGPVCVGSKGCLTTTADFAKLFNSYPGHAAISGGKHFNKWRDAVGKGVAKCLKNYIDGVTVPGLPWYPAFAAFPGPVAPPMPNTPATLAMCPSTGTADITVGKKIQKAILDEFDGDLADDCQEKIHKTIFMAIGETLATGFSIWMPTQTINLVMGTGQIPTFAPPVVPAGPVVNGQNIPSGGGNLMP